MEIHHHPNVEKKKNLKEYFLEFLMIFLAVTLGFFAENIRERIVDHEKEHHLMQSLVEDLKKDTSEMSQVLADQRYFIIRMDSALGIREERLKEISSQDTFYHHFIFFYSWLFLFFNHDNTTAQLKNAGGFNLIRNTEVVDSIGDLQLFFEQQVKFNGDFYKDFWRRVVELGAKIMKMPEPPVQFHDPAFEVIPDHVRVFTSLETGPVEELYSWIRNEKGTLLVYMDNEIKYDSQVKRLIALLTKEFDLGPE